MSISQNGWQANDRNLVESREVPGTNVRLTVRKGAAGDVLIYVAQQFHERVEPISNARGGLDDWGYAERPIRGGSDLSNHASGTAIDLNATEHPLGAEGTFTARQKHEIQEILAETQGVVRWGGHYSSRKDEMHFEINENASKVRVAARALPTVTQEKDVVKDGESLKDVQEDLNFIMENTSWQLGKILKVDGIWGKLTLGVLDNLRRIWGLRARGDRPNMLDLNKIDRTIHEIKEHNAHG